MRSVRWRLLVTLAMVAGGLVPAMSMAAAPAPVLAVRGGRTASVDLVLRRALQVDAGPWFRSAGTNNVIGGDFAGLVLERADGSLLMSFLAVRGMAYKGGQATWILSPEPPELSDFFILTLRPGRYRATLLADAPSEFRLPIVGGSGTSLLFQAKGPGPKVTGLRRDLALAGAAGLGSGELPLIAKPSNESHFVGFFSSPHSVYHAMHYCVAPEGQRCVPPTGPILGNGWSGDDIGTAGQGGGGLRRTLHDHRNPLATGNYTVAVSAVGSITADAQLAFVLTIDWIGVRRPRLVG